MFSNYLIMFFSFLAVCDSHERATDCVNLCNTCDAGCDTCQFNMCRPGCDCMDGFKRDSNGTCIAAFECPPCK